MPVFGHFFPLYNVVNYLIVHFYPYHYLLIVTLDALMYAGLLAAFYRLTSLFHPDRYRTVALTALLGVSVMQIPSVLWWSNSLGNLPTIGLGLLALDGLSRYELLGGRRYLVCSVASFAIALGFFESALILLIAAPLLWALFLRDEARGLIAAFVGRWRVWLAYLIPGALDLGYRTAHHALYSLPSQLNQQPTTLGTYFAYLRTAWAFGFSPSMIGFDYPYRTLFGVRSLTVVLAQAVVLGTIAVTILVRRSAWRAWAFFFPVYLVELLATGYARLAQRGAAQAGLIDDYLISGASFFLLAVALATAPHPYRHSPAQSNDAVANARDRESTLRNPIRAPAFLVVIAFAIIISSVATDLMISSTTDPVASMTLFENPTNPRISRLFFDSLITNASTVRNRLPQMLVYDTVAPEQALGDDVFQYRPASEILTDVVPWLVFNRPGLSDYIVSADNTFVPATLLPFARGRLFGSPRITAGHASIHHGAHGTDCVTTSSPSTMLIRFTSTKKIAVEQVPLLEIAYSSRTSLVVNSSLEVGSLTYPTEPNRSPLVFSQKARFVIVDLTRVQFDRLVLHLPARADLCLDYINAGAPVATGP
jgi:hypothetical protein